MSTLLKCPQCGASEPTLLQDNIYQCRFCGSIYESGEKPEPQVQLDLPQEFDPSRLKGIVSKITRLVLVVFMLPVVIFVVTIIFTSKRTIFTKTNNTVSTKLYKDYNESTNFFTVVNADAGPEVWTVSRRNSDGLKEVSYALNKIDPIKNKIVATKEIGKTITWDQSNSDEYRMNALKPIGKICWLIYGNKLIGYDVNTQEEIENNETLKRKFAALKNGIAKVDDVYAIDGFKLTTNDGYVFYYMPTENKVFSEKEYNDKSYLTKEYEDKTEYFFTDNERQQLYKINRKAAKTLDSKLSSSTITYVLKNNTDWYRKTYKINSIEEFTPNEIYFNASVLYNDDNKIIIIYQKALGKENPIFLTCLDAQKKEVWSKTGSEVELFKPFLKSTNSESFMQNNQVVFIQPFQLAVVVNINNGEILWSFKPY